MGISQPRADRATPFPCWCILLFSYYSMANTAARVRSRKRAKNDIRHLVPPSNPSTVEPIEQPLNLCVRDDVTPQVAIATATEEVEKTRRRKKRSAIFLPPEKLNENNVCICKFKFVAGDSPRLQEKKVLSLDSGGNFKFFPEASSSATSSPSPSTSKPLPDLLPIENNWSEKQPKKLSRRQKMEQSFGDKGFLIQTQHVPATEGAAFCKFRQLKKFTRYLYRSWRHYLPQQDHQPTD